MNNLSDLFEDIYLFNDLMGNSFGCGVDDKEKIKLQVKLGLEELKELSVALTTNNRIEIRDAIADNLVIAGGLIHKAGLSDWKTKEIPATPCILDLYLLWNSCINDPMNVGYVVQSIITIAAYHKIPLESDLKAVNTSNFSKFCPTMEAAIESQEWFETFGVETVIVGSSPYFSIKCAEDFKGLVNGKEKEFPKGKLLKPISYREPIFMSEEPNEFK